MAEIIWICVPIEISECEWNSMRFTWTIRKILCVCTRKFMCGHGEQTHKNDRVNKWQWLRVILIIFCFFFKLHGSFCLLYFLCKYLSINKPKKDVTAKHSGFFFPFFRHAESMMNAFTDIDIKPKKFLIRFSLE